MSDFCLTPMMIIIAKQNNVYICNARKSHKTEDMLVMERNELIKYVK